MFEEMSRERERGDKSRDRGVRGTQGMVQAGMVQLIRRATQEERDEDGDSDGESSDGTIDDSWPELPSSHDGLDGAATCEVDGAGHVTQELTPRGRVRGRISSTVGMALRRVTSIIDFGQKKKPASHSSLHTVTATSSSTHECCIGIPARVAARAFNACFHLTVALIAAHGLTPTLRVRARRCSPCGTHFVTRRSSRRWRRRSQSTTSRMRPLCVRLSFTCCSTVSGECDGLIAGLTAAPVGRKEGTCQSWALGEV